MAPTDVTALAERRPAPVPNEHPEGVQVKTIPVFDRWSWHPGRKLTLAKLMSAYDEADLGYPERMVEIWEDRIQADAHLRAALEQRRDSVSQVAWVVLPGGDGAADAQAAAELETRLRLVPNFEETLQHQAEAQWYGWAGSEIDWQIVDGMAAPVWFENVARQRFLFDDADRPQLRNDFISTQGEELTPGKWWWGRRHSRITTAGGLLRTAAIWSLFKTMSTKDWLVLANRWGIPYVLGKYDPQELGGDAEEEKKVAKRALQMIGTDGYALINSAIEIEIVNASESGGEGRIHDRLMAVCDQQISKLVNGATLLSETTGQASYAIGRVHESRGTRLLQADARHLAKSFEMSVGLPFVRYNGLPARPPRLKLYVALDLGPAGWLAIFDGALNKLGLALDEDQVRQELYLKPPTGAALAPPAPAAPPAGDEPDDAPE